MERKNHKNIVKILQHIKLENIFSEYINNDQKEKIYKALKKSERLNSEMGIETMDRRENSHCTKKEIQIANKYAKEFQLISHYEYKN